MRILQIFFNQNWLFRIYLNVSLKDSKCLLNIVLRSPLAQNMVNIEINMK